MSEHRQIGRNMGDDDESPYRNDKNLHGRDTAYRDGTSGRARIRASWCQEPLLSFAGERKHVDPKTGLARYGPASLGLPRHPDQLRLGFVGSGTSVKAAQEWFRRTAPGVAGDVKKKLPEFPGFTGDRGFFSSLVEADNLIEILTTHEVAGLKKAKKAAERFDATVALIGDRVRLLAQQDDRPDLIVLALPDELIAITKRVKFHDPTQGLVFRNLRRALKAELMRFQVPTQILLQRVSEAEPGAKGIDHLSRVAWNMYTSIFFKGGGVPWQPVGLRPDTCYIGISFHRPLGTTDHTLRSSVAQAFDEHGTGLVLRGPDFPWDAKKDGPSPHLSADQAKALIDLVLRRYKQETHRAPARVVIHKTSRFWDAEHDGFRDALARITQFDLVAVAPTSEIRLVRAGNYPPLRGTLFTVGEIAYLYTTGYIPALKAYPHGHVPAPLQIADHHGDTAIQDIAAEMLLLTKMNMNSAGFAGALPITVRFSRLVGDIMREVPLDREPMPQLKFYI